MSDNLTVGTWNAYNAFGTERVSEALEVVKRMDADVLYLAEMTDIAAKGNEFDQLAQAELRVQGYQGMTSGYSDKDGVRNAHTMSIWTRRGETVQHQLGDRFALGVLLGDMAVVGAHFPDDSEAKRWSGADDLVALRSKTGEMIAMGDFNAMYWGDWRAAIARRVGRMNGLQVKDYYDSNWFQRAVGKALRVTEMADGDTMMLLANAGLHDADPHRRPTVHQHGLSFAIDHILGSSGVTFTDFTRHKRSIRGGKPLSDHNGLTAVAHV